MKSNFTIIRTNTTQLGYNGVPITILTDRCLTPVAVVVLIFLLSIKYEGFSITISNISNVVHISEDRVKKAVKLLRDTGYISTERVKKGSLYSGWYWQIADVAGYFNKSSEV